MIQRMKLVKRITDDGLLEMEDDVPLGKEYIVDTDTMREATLQYLPSHKIHKKMIVTEVQTGTWLAMELLEAMD